MGRKVRIGSRDWGWDVCVNTIKTHHVKKRLTENLSLMLLMRFFREDLD